MEDDSLGGDRWIGAFARVPTSLDRASAEVRLVADDNAA